MVEVRGLLFHDLLHYVPHDAFAPVENGPLRFHSHVALLILVAEHSEKRERKSDPIFERTLDALRTKPAEPLPPEDAAPEIPVELKMP